MQFPEQKKSSYILEHYYVAKVKNDPDNHHPDVHGRSALVSPNNMCHNLVRWKK